jgi:hypothetical protein
MIGRALTALAIIAGVGLAALPAQGAEATLLCVNAGHEYKVGDYACIAACHGKRRYARCDMIAEKTSWTFISDVCPTAHLTPPDPTEITLAPVVTAMSPIPVVVDRCAVDPQSAYRAPS